MKAILEFDLDNPDEEMAHKRACKALDMACVLFEIEHNLKKKCEYKVEENRRETGETLQVPMLNPSDGIDLVFNEIRNLFEENNINLEEIIN